MRYFSIQNQQLVSAPQPPAGAYPLWQRVQMLPPLISQMHENFQAWGRLGLSPGPIIPRRVWVGVDGALAFQVAGDAQPRPLYQLYQASLGPDLAAWLVLLDKWMETFVVLARARAVWSVEELAGALRFCCPAYLPGPLLAHPPDNWARVAHALSMAVADRPLINSSAPEQAPANRHWQPT
jgi:hypothetical protein